MTVQQDVLARAASRIGYYAPNDPQPGSEAGRYWANKVNQAWLAGPSNTIWWCMLFVSMCLDEIGQIDSIGGFSYNTDVTLNRNRGRLVPVSAAQPGDVVIFNWGFTGGTDHVGFVERNLGGGRLQTIEGNTSSGAAGSQSSGNGVWRRIRSSDIAAVIRPAYSGVTVTPVVAGYNPNGYDVAYVKDVQSRLESLGYSVGSSGADGILGPDTFNAVKAYQSAVGLATDGIPGPDTLGALKAGKGREAVANALSDGVWGPVTTGALQRLLGTPQDGVISSQDQGRRVNVPAAGDGWEWVSNPQGSQAIKAYQQKLGIDADGIIGPGTIRRLQDHLGVTVDGYAGMETVKALQAQLGQGRI